VAVWSVVKLSELEGTKRLDAEYYQPKYHKTFYAVISFGCFPLKDAITTLYRYPTFYNLEYQESGVLVLKGEDIEDSGLIDSKHEDHISNDVSQKFPKTVLNQGDIVLSVRGYVGKVGLIDSSLAGSQISPNLIRLALNSSKVNPYFVWLFLNTRFGQLQLERAKMRTSQETILADGIKGILFPSFKREKQQPFELVVKQAVEQFGQSKLLYLKAEQTVLNEIGWDKLDLSQPKFWTVPLSHAHDIDRLDAEHFQPKYDKLLNHIRKTDRAKPLTEIAAFVKRGLQPTYVPDGDIIVVNSQHLGRYLLNVEATERTDRNFWQQNQRSMLCKNDILLYSTGAYVGRSNVYLEDKDAIASNHVTIIRAHPLCNPLYLAVFLNSPLGILQAYKWASGSGQRELYPHDIKRFLVYLPPENLQQKVAALILQAYNARQKAKALLEKAKRAVEIAVEGGEEPSERFLKT
jgi:hypothetical protein